MGFYSGNKDGKHYWLTPPDLMQQLHDKYNFDFDPCPYPKPDNFDGLTCDWGKSNYVNPPFGSIIHEGKKKGVTAWVRKALAEKEKGNSTVLVYPVQKWVLMLLKHAKYVENLGDVKWCSIEDGTPGKGIGQHIALFYIEGSDERSK